MRHSADLLVELPRLEVFLGGKVLEPGDLDIEDGGEGEVLQLPLREEHLLPLPVATPERGARDHVGGELLEPAA
jgi:hypothetical protein